MEEHIEKVIEERMQVLEQLTKEAIPRQQEADKGPPESSWYQNNSCYNK